MGHLSLFHTCIFSVFTFHSQPVAHDSFVIDLWCFLLFLHHSATFYDRVYYYQLIGWPTLDHFQKVFAFLFGWRYFQKLLFVCMGIFGKKTVIRKYLWIHAHAKQSGIKCEQRPVRAQILVVWNQAAAQIIRKPQSGMSKFCVEAICSCLSDN